MAPVAQGKDARNAHERREKGDGPPPSMTTTAPPPRVVKTNFWLGSLVAGGLLLAIMALLHSLRLTGLGGFPADLSLLSSASSSSAVGSYSNGGPPTVTVKNGTYAGVHSPEYDQDFFLGVPYAQKPERFSQARPLDAAWDGVREAAAYPPHCVGYGDDHAGYAASEDCLSLNIVRPAAAAPARLAPARAGLPVAVWIHGGGLFMGGSADRRYNLSFLVEHSAQLGTPVIGVSLNYRLSAFGFLQGREALAAGATNVGFHDQRLALRWLRENVAAFGGDPDRVTIFGESSGAESVTAQLLAYNGRDDGLFRGAVGQSGFGGFVPRYPGGLNATAARQATFDALVTNVTACAPHVGTARALECLRTAPSAELDRALSKSVAVAAWGPVLDGDFIAEYPTNQLRDGRFVRVPLLVGCNTDEGSAFGRGAGVVNTDDEFARAVRRLFADPDASATDALVAQAAYLYPDVQSVGIPSLAAWPEVLVSGGSSSSAERLGLQYRRTSAFWGDHYMHATRRRANAAWDREGLRSWSYRFDVKPFGLPEELAATHFQEVAFVFDNVGGDGYASNPFGPDANATAARQMRELARVMSAAWIRFFVAQDPNRNVQVDGDREGEGALEPAWPVYRTADGGGVGRNMVWRAGDGSARGSGSGSYVEMDDYRAAGMRWFDETRLEAFGD